MNGTKRKYNAKPCHGQGLTQLLVVVVVVVFVVIVVFYCGSIFLTWTNSMVIFKYFFVCFIPQIEEQILENLAWSHDSPLWSAINEAGSVPSCEDVTVPNTVESLHPNQHLLASPIVHPRVQRICGEEMSKRGEI